MSSFYLRKNTNKDTFLVLETQGQFQLSTRVMAITKMYHKYNKNIHHNYRNCHENKIENFTVNINRKVDNDKEKGDF